MLILAMLVLTEYLAIFIRTHATEHNKMSQLMMMCVTDRHWVFLQHFQFDLVTVDMIRHPTVCHSHFGPLCHCG